MVDDGRTLTFEGYAATDSKLTIDGGGAEKDITFTAADSANIYFIGGSDANATHLYINGTKAQAINALLGDGNDTLVIQAGFWSDYAGNVQVTGSDLTKTGFLGFL